MSTLTEPAAPSPNGAVAAPPTPLHPGPQMVPVDFTRLDPLPPPPRKENSTLIHFGTAIAALGSVVLVLALFLAPWFSVREVTITQPQQGQSQSQGQNGNSQTTLNNRSRFGVMRDLEDFGVASWASARRVKRDGAIIALALLTQGVVLVSSVSYRWRLFLALGGGGALAALLLTLLDFQNLPDLIQERLRTGSPFGGGFATNGSIVKIIDPRPGLGMTVLLIGTACVVLGAVIALMGGRRGKVIAPVAP